MIIAVDFDGTICESEWPEIGKPLPGSIETMKALQETGHTLILWTCRSGKCLDDAVDWLFNKGIVPDAVNKNVERDFLTLGDTRKIYADIYLDDRSFFGISKSYDWADVWNRYIEAPITWSKQQESEDDFDETPYYEDEDHPYFSSEKGYGETIYDQ